MREIARLPEKDRRDLFRAAAQKMRAHEAIVEKDFWVCWTLDYLFHDCAWKDQMVFKGGTSLAKAFGVIERFSEDIDLILDWRLLGYSSEEPWDERSPTKQDSFCKKANQKAAEFLERDFAPALRPALAQRAGCVLEVETRGQIVLIQYPRAFSLGAIQPQIMLEIGPLAALTPNETRTISPYAAEQIPATFRQPQTTVRTIIVERSFWEKATILHQEAHRGPDKPLPSRCSRHYYDLYRLSRRAPIRNATLARPDLLDEVARFKMKFYRCNWARYEEAKPGSLRLLPPGHHIADLRKDYRAMQSLLFGAIPPFDDILEEMRALEKDINELSTTVS